MRIGLTGGRGILGRIAHKQLLARGHEVNAYAGDVCNLPAMQAWAADARADAVLHFAAVVPTQTVQADTARAFCVNVGGTANLITALAEGPKKPWVFYASSSHVYRPQAEPLSENSPVSPLNPYGLSKRMGEQVVETSVRAACASYPRSYLGPSEPNGSNPPAVRPARLPCDRGCLRGTRFRIQRN